MSFGSPAVRFGSGIVRRLSQADRPARELRFKVFLRRRNHRSVLVDDPDASETLEALTHAVADETLGYDRRKQLYEAATVAGLPAVARLFLVASPQGELPRPGGCAMPSRRCERSKSG